MISRIIVGEITADVFTQYELKDVVKTIHGRRWDPDRRCWVIPAGMATDCAARLGEYGERVTITDRHGNPWPPKQQKKVDTNPFDPLFARVGPVLRERLYKALTKVLHPDTSGADTHQLMAELNTARDRTPRGGVRDDRAV